MEVCHVSYDGAWENWNVWDGFSSYEATTSINEPHFSTYDGGFGRTEVVRKHFPSIFTKFTSSLPMLIITPNNLIFCLFNLILSFSAA